MSDDTENWEAWSDGLSARLKGTPRDSNPHTPYEEAEAYTAWDEGWADADSDPGVQADVPTIQPSPHTNPVKP